MEPPPVQNGSYGRFTDATGRDRETLGRTERDWERLGQLEREWESVGETKTAGEKL